MSTLKSEHNDASGRLDDLVSTRFASRLAAGDHTLWGAEAEAEAAKRLGWIDPSGTDPQLLDRIEALRDELHAAGITRVLLAGMGGSSLAPEVIATAVGAPLTVLDATSPGQVQRSVASAIADSAIVISSKSGSTIETDSALRASVAALTEQGIDPRERIVVVTDPGSDLSALATEAGYRLFHADPQVGGRFSALTAFGLVPTGLAGCDTRQLVADAAAAQALIAADSSENPALALAAALTDPDRPAIGLFAETPEFAGLPDWIEQLVAESTGKLGRGLLPVPLHDGAPEVANPPRDLQLVRLTGQAAADLHGDAGPAARVTAEGAATRVAAPLGAQFLIWEAAVAAAGRLLGINPFDQPDVEAAKVAARQLLNDASGPTAAGAGEGAGTDADAVPTEPQSAVAALDALLGQLPANGYVAIQAYCDRALLPGAAALRDGIAARTGRPVTFGWGPRFLHSTGQYHKGGPRTGVFLQLVEHADEDLQIPGLPFSFGELLRAQAAGDARVLADHGMPVATIELSGGAAEVAETIANLQGATA